MAGSDAARTISILYVDDDPDLRAIVKISLELDDRLIVQTAASAVEALVALETWQPDALLLDVSMPDANGIELLGMLRAKGVIAPAIFLTAHARDVEHDRLKATGASAILTKPFDPLTLAATLGALLQGIR